MELLTNFILNELQNLVVVASPHGQLKYVNNYTFELLGLNYPDKNLFGYRKQINNAKHITHEILVEYDSCKRKQTKNSFEKKLIGANGQTHWIMWNVSLSTEGNFVGIGYDITDKKLAEISLQQKSYLLEQQQKDVISSIQYAQRIQESILPDVSKLKKYFAGAFVLYKPRDYVSGDFYWTTRQGDNIFIAVADCTGHGVPGAMMAIMGNAFLNNTVRKHSFIDCDTILYELDREIQVNLNQKKNGARDGMDISIIRLNIVTKELQFSGAMRGIFVFHKNELHEIRAAKYPLGFFDDIEKQFFNTEITLNKGDRIYLTTDGYADQFGGENDKKFNKKQFRELLYALKEMPMDEQQHYVDYVLQNWQQQTEQTDDVTVFGLEI
jgi:serine phosphatase RsbU (regulator of sigma subunit)